MGLFSRKPQVIEAQYAPQVMGENMPSLYNAIFARISRHDAMSVPSVARARNLICGTVASIPLEYYKTSTGEVIAPPRWIKQLSKNQPSFVTLTWCVDSLLFYGVAYLLVTERYAEDGRPAQFEWVANSRIYDQYDVYELDFAEEPDLLLEREEEETIELERINKINQVTESAYFYEKALFKMWCSGMSARDLTKTMLSGQK